MPPMSLSQESIECILAFLDPHLDTLQTGFPTSSRPNEPSLTSAQKRDKISATLASSPGIFLTRWGSVILYPRPESTINATKDAVPSTKTSRDILELFAPLQNDYEVKYQLNRLFQQLHRVTEQRQFEARHTTTLQGSISSPLSSSSTSSSPTSPLKHHINAPIADEDRKPEPGQSDLFNRTALSPNARRNRRLNYLLRHLAPPDSSESFSSRVPPPTSRPNHSDATTATITERAPHPTLATILSISGSMSNLSFAESTYFSDAEMEARAPDLYQQYIGRFMDNDENDDDQDEGDDNHESAGSDADDEREGVEPFGDDIGLVDRILWNVDHPSKHQLKRERQETKDRKSQYEEHHHGNSNRVKKELSAPRPAVPPRQVSEDDLEEEFDTESGEDEDTEMPLKESVSAKAKSDDAHRGPLASVPESEIRARTSVTPRLPPEPKRSGMLSSTMASAAFTLEQPEERAIFAEVENGNDDSENGIEDEVTEHRKEDQEALRREFVLLMKQRFLDGLDSNFDYSSVDFNEDLDDLEQQAHDEEDRYFDAEDEGEDEGEGEGDAFVMDDGLDDKGPGASMEKESDGSPSAYFASSPHPYASKKKHAHDRGTDLGDMNYDERLASWESRPQNGAGDYDY
ncbi:hypothetical protein BGZ52_002662 [Haplosporangium bisporale]|nr:hypothetical protein BGZ52_002662 [Haplosporangium bisporale]